jgi:replicative DNA helicase
VSVTDDVRPGAMPPAGPPPDDRGGADERGSYERTPPQDIAAEQCVLGGMMLSKDAIADVVEILRSTDFYRPAHSMIFDTILEMYGRGDPADMITVASVMADAGTLQRVGGASYLHDLVSTVPTAANAAYYARIVAERAVLRRLVEAGTRIVQLGYGSAAGAGRDVDDIVDLAQQAVYDVTERRVSEDFAVLADMLQPTLDEIEAVGAQGGVMTGVPTGFTDLDRLLNGLHPGQLIVVAGRPGLGKALALDTPLATPDGWTTMGEVSVGDQLIGADGRPTTVIATSPVMYDRPCYEVEFSDGTVIVADGSHRWLTHDWESRRYRRQPRVRTTEEIAATLRVAMADATATADATTAEVTVTADAAATADATATADGGLNHSVTNCQPLALAERDLLVPPYTLGVWLGCGHTAAARFTTDDPELILYIEEEGLTVRADGRRHYTICLPHPEPACVECGESAQGREGDLGRFGSVTARLRTLGVLDHRHIPASYLRASHWQRRALLAGLLDADGTVAPSGDVQYCSTSRQLAEDVRELVVSLGYRCTTTSKEVHGRSAATSTAYRLTISTADDVFRLERKRLAHKEVRATTNTETRSRFIVDARPVASVPVRCVTVDNANHLYLASRSMIPTHNSTASMDFARNASVRHNLASAIFSLEMSKVEIVMRLLSAEARVPLHVLRSGQLSDDDWTKLARRMGEISEAPLFVDDTPNMTLMEIRAKARRLKQRHDLKLIVVDYLQLMTSPKRVESRQQEVAELSRGLKLLAKEVECPVVAVSQLNRGPEQRTDKRPQLSDLRESGSIEQDADVVILLHRDDYYDKESPRAGEADFIVAKHRNGPTDTVTVAAQLHLSRFVDMAVP